MKTAMHRASERDDHERTAPDVCVIVAGLKRAVNPRV